MINFSTGPIDLEPNVRRALAAETFSHRAPEFQAIHDEMVALLCKQFNVKETFLLQGSGTLANEVMLYQIKKLGGKGIVLSNGEFGDRLVDQATRAALDFFEYSIAWGEPFIIRDVADKIKAHQAQWILLAHCETSTGCIMPFEELSQMVEVANCKLFVDCMSTLGTQAINLASVSMATGSSGKGLGSLPGMGIVFSNLPIQQNQMIPKYFDLFHYKQKNGIPFTLSSNQLIALQTALKKTMAPPYWHTKRLQAERIFNALKPLNLIPFATKYSMVFTIVQATVSSKTLSTSLETAGIVLSFQSQYLLERRWLQLALFGSYTDKQIDTAIRILKNEFTKYEY